HLQTCLSVVLLSKKIAISFLTWYINHTLMSEFQDAVFSFNLLNGRIKKLKKQFALKETKKISTAN
ncbi:MAG TPA: hypothetical protein VL201_01750, partial [Patescibacteria group bacterium]|nr:hypothetical protein [Patescibacteria group bacterium]